MKMSKSARADLALLFITLVWGSTFVIVKRSLAQVSPILFLAMRFWLATFVILVFMPTAMRHMSLRTFKRGFVLSVYLLGGFLFQTLGLRGTTPSRSAFITSLAVLLVPLLGFLIFRYRPRLRTLAGVVMATVGLGLLTLNTLELNLRYGDVLTLICAGVFALHILFIGRYTPTTDYRQLVTLQVGLSAVVCTLIMPVLEMPFLVWDATLTLYLLVTGILATALAFYLQNWAQQFTTPNRTALIFSLEPFAAALFAYLLMGSSLTPREWIGGGLVLGGILTSELRRGGGPWPPCLRDQGSGTAG